MWQRCFLFLEIREKTGCQNWWHRWGYKQCHGRHGFSWSMNLPTLWPVNDVTEGSTQEAPWVLPREVAYMVWISVLFSYM